MAGFFKSLLSVFGGAPAKPVFSSSESPNARYRDAKAAPAEGSHAPAPAPHELRVTEVVRETADAVTIRFQTTSGEPLRYRAGQFLTFNLTVGGEELRRAYSLSSCPLDGPGASVTVKRVAGGRASNHLNDTIAPGAILHALGPSGEFVVANPADAASPDGGARRPLVLLAGGSGITPIYSILTTLLREDPAADVTLLYGNRSAADIIFRAPLAALAAAHPGLRLRHVLDQPCDDGTVETAAIGPLTGARVLEQLDERALAGSDFFICGPAPMMDSAVEALAGAGVPAARVHVERFTSLPSVEHHRPAERHPIRFLRSKREVLPAPGQSVLDAGLDAGLPLKYSCTLGGCAACRVKLARGTVQMDEPNCLSKSERDAGYILACISCPTSPIEVEA